MIPSGSSPLVGSSNISTSGPRVVRRRSRGAGAFRERRTRLATLDSGQSDLVEDRADTVCRDAITRCERQQVVPCGPSRVRGVRVEQRAGQRQRFLRFRERLAVDRGTAGGRPVEAEDHAHRGGFAGTVGTEESGHHPGAHRERHAVDRPGRSVYLGELVHFDRGHALSVIRSGRAISPHGWDSSPPFRGATGGVATGTMNA